MKRIGLCSFLLLGGCMVGPDYCEPPVPVPGKWGNVTETDQKKPPIWQEVYWWENYQDPLLTCLVRDALKSNNDLKVAFAKICEARAGLLGADAAILPQIVAVGSYTRNASSLNSTGFSIGQDSATDFGSAGSGRYFDVYSIGLTTTWEVDLFGRLRRGLESAEANLEFTVEDMHNTLLSLIADVVLNYINLRGYQQQWAVTQQLVESWDSIYKLNQDLLKAGIATEIDVAQAKASRDQATASLFPLTASIKKAMHQLSVLVGKSPTCLYGILSKIKPIPQVPSKIFAGLPSELLRRRPDIRAAERKLAGSTADIGVAEGSLFPIFSLTGNVGYQSNHLFNFVSPQSSFYSFGPTFSWPIMDFGRVRAQIDAAIAIRDENFYQYKSTLLKAFAEVENSLVNYDAEARRQHDLKSAYEANQLASEASLARYKAGRINFINVLQAELAYQTSILTLIQSQTTLALNSVLLYKALGGGWQVDQTGWCSDPH
jgi:NodT family efflux transporter outer membrane factor (OMF) lipoprotein